MKIKSTVALICCISVWCVHAAGDTARVTALLEALEKTVPEDYRDPGALVEKDDWSKEPDFRELQALIARDWATHVPAISTLAPSNNAKTIYFKAAQVLNQKQYLKLLVATADHAEAGEIHPMQFRWIVSPYEKHLRKMWEEDPPSEELKIAAARVREVVGADSNMGKLMTRIIAGEMRASLRNDDSDANPLPKLPTQAAPSTSTPPPAAPPLVVKVSPPVAQPPANSSNPLWWIAGAIAALVAVVVVVRRKKSKA